MASIIDLHTPVWFASVGTMSEANSNAYHLRPSSHAWVESEASLRNEELKLLEVALYWSLIHYVLVDYYYYYYR